MLRLFHGCSVIAFYFSSSPHIWDFKHTSPDLKFPFSRIMIHSDLKSDRFIRFIQIIVMYLLIISIDEWNKRVTVLCAQTDSMTYRKHSKGEGRRYVTKYLK